MTRFEANPHSIIMFGNEVGKCCFSKDAGKNDDLQARGRLSQIWRAM